MRSPAVGASKYGVTGARDLAAKMRQSVGQTGKAVQDSVASGVQAAGGGLAQARGALGQQRSTPSPQRSPRAPADLASPSGQCGTPGGSITASMFKRAQDGASGRAEQAQQKTAQKAANAYISTATGGLVKSVPPSVSNAALGHAKKNPKDAMKFAKFAAKAL